MLSRLRKILISVLLLFVAKSFLLSSCTEMKDFLTKPISKGRTSLGMKVVGGKLVPGGGSQVGAFVTEICPGGLVDSLGQVKEGDQILEWNGVPLTNKSYEEVQRIIAETGGEVELLVQSPDRGEPISFTDRGYESSPDNTNYASEGYGTDTDWSSGYKLSAAGRSRSEHGTLDREGKASPSFCTTPPPPQIQATTRGVVTGEIKVKIVYDEATETLFVSVLEGRNLTQDNNARMPNPFVKIYLLPGRKPEHKRRTKYISGTPNPEWRQTVVYKDLLPEDLPFFFLEFTVWDYRPSGENVFLGMIALYLSGEEDCSADLRIINQPARWFGLVPQCDGLLNTSGTYLEDPFGLPQFHWE